MGFFSEHLCNHWSEDDEDIISELRREKEKYYKQTLDDEIQINELLQTLQEIKKICKMDCGECQYNQDCDCNFEECEEAKIDDILDLITKAESEG